VELNRKIIIKKHSHSDLEDEFCSLPPSSCLSEVWELTKEIYSLTKQFDVKSRLQRNVVHFIKGKNKKKNSLPPRTPTDCVKTHF